MQKPAANENPVPASGKDFGAKRLAVLEENPWNRASSCEKSLDSILCLLALQGVVLRHCIFEFVMVSIVAIVVSPPLLLAFVFHVLPKFVETFSIILVLEESEMALPGFGPCGVFSGVG
jgi:hypothetical protein